MAALIDCAVLPAEREAVLRDGASLALVVADADERNCGAIGVRFVGAQVGYGNAVSAAAEAGVFGVGAHIVLSCQFATNWVVF